MQLGHNDNSVDRTSLFGLGIYGIRSCASSQTKAHDVVGAITWLKRWAEGKKGEDVMKVMRGKGAKFLVKLPL